MTLRTGGARDGTRRTARWRALEDTRLYRNVALKFLPEKCLGEAVALEEFRREGKTFLAGHRAEAIDGKDH
jgi:hypothetical protein